ncbi:MAG: hypothetical protein U9Q74_08595 [Gemmatimonadota bacterium]|nr:hypothetical protein [Gemmatimonadota bacterium]
MTRGNISSRERKVAWRLTRLVLIGAFRTQPIAATISATVVVFAAVYLLWALQRIIYNPLTKPENAALRDLNWRELGLLVPLVAAIFWLGLYPAPVLNRTHAAATRVVERVGGIPEANPTDLTVRR